MKIALIGATGKAGSRILAELLRRGHTVTGIARNPEKLSSHDHLAVRQGDANDEENLAALLSGHEAVISAITYKAVNLPSFIAAVKKSDAPRLLVVGNAGSLEVASGMQVIDSPHFPAEHKEQALAHRELLDLLSGEQELDWTFLSPSVFFEAGERTGKFRLGTDQLLVNPSGESRISFEDFAIALVDELETPQHSRTRFTVGY